MKHLELFDAAGVDLRQQIRDIRDDKKRAYLENSSLWRLTLREYAELRVLGRLMSECSDLDIREASVLTHKRVGWNPYWHPEYHAHISIHRKHVEEAIQDIVDMYTENNGMYNTQGKLYYRRVVDQAVKLRLPVPEKVKQQFR